MAEPPHCWDLLTASLAVADLKQPAFAWAFLVVQGLVRDARGDRERFFEIAAEESAQAVTGPTEARRVAMRLASEGIALQASSAADPWGKLAAQRLQVLQSWTGGTSAARYLDQIARAGF